MPIIQELVDSDQNQPNSIIGPSTETPSTLGSSGSGEVTIFGFTFSSSSSAPSQTSSSFVQMGSGAVKFLGSCSSAAESSGGSSERVSVGYLETNVVGLQYYGAKINARQMVGLIREPINSYDPNAIRVVNIRDEQVGHIDRRVAAVLAPLIDADLVVVQGIAKPASGKRNVFKLPCEVHVFSRMEVMERVKAEIGASGLEFILGNNPAYALSEAVAVKDKRAIPDEKSVDQIFSLLDKALSREGTLVPMEPPKTVITTELLSHQKEGLRWLFLRENSQELPPFWEQKEGKYVNVLTCFETQTCPDPFLGGIFADDMGMGKTLTLLSLIATDKCGWTLPSSIDSKEANHPVVRTGKKRGRGGKWGTDVQKKRKIKGIPAVGSVGEQIFFDGQSESLCSRTTLIVCPTSVLSAWVKQLEVHTRRGSLKTYLYHGERTKDANEVQEYDLVLTTYSTVGSEASLEDSPLRKVQWYRIILDEAHLIKNPNAQQSRAVASLTARRRWVVTGTPIQNDSFDMFSLMAFLRLEPLSTKKWWNNYIAFPLNRGEKKGLSRLQVLMASISLRRTKEKCLVDLPSKRIETFLVDLSEEEREFYDQMEAEVKNFVQGYISSQLATSHYTNVLSILIRLRQACVDIALCPSTFGDIASMEDARSKPELLNKLKLLMDENEEVDFDCPICISAPSDAVITSCAHIFCRACILTTLRKSKESCPLCRCPLRVSDLFSLPPEVSSTTESSAISKSSKVMALLKFLSASREEDPTRKSVVFSQFRKLLISLEGTLKEAGFKVLRVDGSMTAKKRGQIIEEFDSSVPNGPTILLASLKAVGAGVNLTAATRVYLMEPWWNPAVEEQAMDRVHRIGQAKEVSIIRMIARNTVEERILLLQEKKKLLARKAFGRKGSKEQREITLSDLATLMNLSR